MRFYLYYPALERLMRAIPTYLEINSNDLTEYRHNHPRYIYLYHRATRGRILRQTRGIVSVSHEVAASLRVAQKPLIVIGNGIDLSQYPIAPAPHNSEPILVFLGSARHIWQGVDKMLILAEQLPMWQFHLIGEMTEAIQQSHLPNVYTHGYLSEAQYAPLLQAADAAFGPLALYRKQMQETSAIKVCEYLAYGLPTIIGYRETNFWEPPPFILQLPNTPEEPDHYVPELVRFVQRWKGQRVPRAEIGHLDVREKERQRLALLSNQ
jgi:glycosyltransferase involved in cell wall biosynthesis